MSKSLLDETQQPNISKNIGHKDPITFLLENPYKEKDIEKVNDYVYGILSEKMDTKINRVLCYRNKDIQLAIELYDKLVLNNILRDSKVQVTGKVSHAQSAINGLTLYKHGIITITIFMQNVSSTFTENRKYSYNERCYDRLECILSVVRHEIIHAIISLYGDATQKAESKAHGNTFKKLFKNIFNGSVTKSYGIHDVDIYPERGKVIGKGLKKGSKAKLIKTTKLEEVTILEEPITYENTELIKYKTKEGKTKTSVLLLFKSPKGTKKTKSKEKKNTLLSPISSAHRITKDIRKTKEGFELGLSYNGFERRALKRGIPKEDIRALYLKYKKEQRDIQEDK